MKGYKAFDKDLRCRGFQFEVGKEYAHNGEIVLCEAGFHFCRRFIDLFNNCGYFSVSRICEIEATGNVIGDDFRGYVTDKILIVRELSEVEISERANFGKDNNGIFNSGNRNSGRLNTGNLNVGASNTGDSNYCNWNSGDFNSGYHNSGHDNFGDYNSGWQNHGKKNSGHNNSGHQNSGHWNLGSSNSGSWNACDFSAGFLNTTEPPVRIFDKNTSLRREEIVFPNFFYFDTCEWINEKQMTDAEKKSHPWWNVTGGYLKTYEYKNAWRRSFEKAKNGKDWKEEKSKLLGLPNFSFGKFEQITGITKEDILS